MNTAGADMHIILHNIHYAHVWKDNEANSDRLPPFTHTEALRHCPEPLPDSAPCNTGCACVSSVASLASVRAVGLRVRFQTVGSHVHDMDVDLRHVFGWIINSRCELSEFARLYGVFRNVELPAL